MSRGRLVGREAELGLLLGLLDAAAAGRPVAALVSGDAGVGKTRLVTELAAGARERGFAVMSGRCAELAGTVPYLPLADALRDAATGPSPGRPLLDALAARPVLSRLLPDRDSGGLPGGDMPGLAQQQLFGAVLGMLAELAQASPVLLILEDLHWADGSTRDLVTFLSRVLHRERLAIVATYRTDDLHRRHPLRPVVTELLRLPSVTSVDLGPLDPTAMAEHLAALSSQQLDATALGQMITRAEGNAYYAEELLAASAAGGSTAAGLGLPAGLAELLVARMERLSGTAQQVLRAAAVTGRRADDELVRQTSGLAAQEYEEAVREAVASAAGA
jgi:predicted ATPase